MVCPPSHSTGNFEFIAVASFPSIPFLTFTPKQACLSANPGGHSIACTPFWDRGHHISVPQSLTFFLVPAEIGTAPFPHPHLQFRPSSLAALQCCVNCSTPVCIHSESVNQLYVCMCSLFLGFPSRLGHHRPLSRVPCAAQ